MTNKQNNLDKIVEDHSYLKNVQIQLFENLNILLQNQKDKGDNQEIVVKNQSLIIKNQEIIVNNQMSIIQNQHKIFENQLALNMILQSQMLTLELVQKLSEDKDISVETKTQIKKLKEDIKIKLN